MKDSITSRVLFLLVFSVSALVAVDSVVAEYLVVELQNSKRIKGRLDAKTDEHRLWVNSSTQGIVLRSQVNWQQVRQVTFRNITVSAAEFREQYLQQQVIGTIPAVPPIRLQAPQRVATRPQARVRSLQIIAHVGNWDADAELDGIVVQVLPRSESGELVPVRGGLDITLFGQKFERIPGASPAVILEQWSRQTSHEQFHPRHGAIFRLEFNRLRNLDLNTLASTGELQVRLGVSGQGVFAARQVLQFKAVRFQHNGQPERRSRFQKAGI